MPRTDEALITPTSLKWARQTARMRIPDAASRAKVDPEQLSNWENGKARPTLRQARRLADTYQQPFAALYLDPAPKLAKEPIPDYRRLPGDHPHDVESTIALNRLTVSRQRLTALEILESLERQAPSFKLTIDMSDGADEAGRRLRSALRLDRKTQLKWRTADKAFRWLRSATEGIGALVVQFSGVPIEVLRAYSLPGRPLPVVAVNRSDAYAARSFSLLHELAHLGLGEGGLCNLKTNTGAPAESQRLEVFCNSAAACALMPALMFRSHPLVSGDKNEEDWNDPDIASIARDFGTSREAVVRRLLDLSMVSQEFYAAKRKAYRAQIAKLPKKKGFISPSVDALSKAGRAFTGIVLEAYSREKITASDLAQALHVRLKHLDAIRKMMSASWPNQRVPALGTSSTHVRLRNSSEYIPAGLHLPRGRL